MPYQFSRNKRIMQLFHTYYNVHYVVPFNDICCCSRCTLITAVSQNSSLLFPKFSKCIAVFSWTQDLTRGRGSLQTPELRSADTSGITSTSFLNQWNADSFFRLATWGEERTHIRGWAATIEPAWNMAAQCASEHQATTMISLWLSWIKHDTLFIWTGTDNKRRPFIWGVLRHKCGFTCLADEADTGIFPNVNRQELAKMRS